MIVGDHQAMRVSRHCARSLFRRSHCLLTLERWQIDAVLKIRGIRRLVITGCTTSTCVESTIRDAMFLDYSCVLLSDCTAEPLGAGLVRTNHEATLYVVEKRFGSISNSAEFLKIFAPTPNP